MISSNNKIHFALVFDVLSEQRKIQAEFEEKVMTKLACLQDSVSLIQTELSIIQGKLNERSLNEQQKVIKTNDKLVIIIL